MEQDRVGSRRKLFVFLPLALFLALAALFFVSLRSGDPARLPSALLGKKTPEFKLPPLEGSLPASGLSTADLKNGSVTLVNIFASWCVPCREEHPVLMGLAQRTDLAARGLRIAGLAYKDEPANSRKFLSEMGNPYALVGVDASGRAGIEWGVYGVPETFVVTGDGTIAYKFVGPLDPQSLRDKLMPEIEKAMRPAENSLRP